MKTPFQRWGKLYSNNAGNLTSKKNTHLPILSKISISLGVTTKPTDTTFAKVWLNHIFNHYHYFLLNIHIMNILSKESNITAVLQKRWTSTSASYYTSIFKPTTENEEPPNKQYISVKLTIKVSNLVKENNSW